MKKIFKKIRFMAMVIADDISIVASICFRRGHDLEMAGIE